MQTTHTDGYVSRLQRDGACVIMSLHEEGISCSRTVEVFVPTGTKVYWNGMTEIHRARRDQWVIHCAIGLVFLRDYGWMIEGDGTYRQWEEWRRGDGSVLERAPDLSHHVNVEELTKAKDHSYNY